MVYISDMELLMGVPIYTLQNTDNTSLRKLLRTIRGSFFFISASMLSYLTSEPSPCKSPHGRVHAHVNYSTEQELTGWKEYTPFDFLSLTDTSDTHNKIDIHPIFIDFYVSDAFLTPHDNG